jgi:tetratricopeptide (TPR) repeat protein
MFSSPRLRRWLLPLLVIGLLIIDLLIAYQIPSIHDRLAWRLDVYGAEVRRLIFPQPDTLSTPNPRAVESARATLTALAPTLSPTVQATAVAPALSPSPTFAPLPARVVLDPPRYEKQLFNNCGPATLSMTLHFWGWTGSQVDTAAALKPMQNDRNVMPYELARYVLDHTDFAVVIRSAGTLTDLKRLIAAGFPPIVEKGFNESDVEKKYGWMGHYNLLTAYDDAAGHFIAQDSFVGPDHALDYETMLSGWRAFNFIYVVVYPSERNEEVLRLLGPNGDEAYNQALAIDSARGETGLLTGQDLAFAWFNLGTSLVNVNDYGPATLAFDEARYAGLPWRMLWYQTGPYFAYFYGGRYQEVIDLANQVLNQRDDLEESWYWRGMARLALGETQAAIDDLHNALAKHPGFPPAVVKLQELGELP